MENKTVNLELKTNVEESIAGLKALKRQLKDTAAGSEEFKKLYNQIDDLEDKIKSAKNVSSDWVDSLEQAGGPLGMLGAGINRAKVATQSFGGALKATGIGLIVSLLGGLVAAFSENQGAMQKIQPLIDGLKKAFQGVFRAVEPLFNTFVDLATEALPYVTKGIGMVYSAMMAYFTFIKESGGGVMKILKGVFTLDADAITAGIDQVGGSFKKTQQSYGESMKRFSDGSKELTKTEKEESEKREENRKKALEKQLENEQKAKEKADELARKKAEEKKKFDEETNAGLQLLNQANLEKQLQDSANKRGLLDEQIALLEEGVAAVEVTEIKTTAITKEQADAKIAIAKAEQNAKLKALEETAKTLNGLSDLLGKQTAAGKIAAVAGATIETFLSAQKAYSATVGIPFVGPVLAPINAGLAIAAGIKNVQSILAVQVPGGGGGGGSVPSAPTIATPPNFNVVGASSTNQLAQTIGNQQQQPVQAYVVSNDVTTAQALDRNIIRGASIG
jgi:hypothetical protein